MPSTTSILRRLKAPAVLLSSGFKKLFTRKKATTRKTGLAASEGVPQALPTTSIARLDVPSPAWQNLVLSDNTSSEIVMPQVVDRSEILDASYLLPPIELGAASSSWPDVPPLKLHYLLPSVATTIGAMTPHTEEVGSDSLEALPKLLRLPPELRLMIYEHVFTTIAYTYITASGVIEPPLLLTCRQLRAEARRTFYWNHRFVVTGQSESALVFFRISWWARYNTHPGGGLQYATWDINYGPPGNWCFLLRELRAVHKGCRTPAIRNFSRLDCPSLREYGDLELSMIFDLFDLVAKSRKKSWQELEDTINQKRISLGTVYEDWWLELPWEQDFLG